MNQIIAKKTAKYKIGQTIGSFKLIKSKTIPELQLTAYHLVHQPTGANFAYIDKDDENNTFAVAFKTIPENSTGVAHILEHTVLCGSKKFPVRDPFFSMLKRSLQNFMNAFTANDWTMYPFSTVNKKDFYNLMDVYLDAAFYPLLKENNFLQEGWRTELEDNKNLKSKLVYKGVVFNEMKGAMSTERDILEHRLISQLLPESTYSNNSGGEPIDILDLSWQDLKDFQKKFYQPSNAWFYYYGKQDVEEVINFVEKKVLQGKKKDQSFSIPEVEKFKKIKRVKFPYPISKDDKKQHQLTISWLLGGVENSSKTLLLKVLSAVLLNNDGAPLRKKLIESKLAESLSDLLGVNDDLKQAFFTVGLKGIDAKNVAKIEPLIIDSLKDIVAKGLDKELIDSVIHQMELEIRELDNGGYSQGLKFLLGFVGSWLHGADYIEHINFEQNLKELKATLKKPKVLENLIKSEILDNKHSLVLELYPDDKYNARQELAIAEKLERFSKKADLNSRKKLQAQALELEALQNKAEDLSVLPKVSIKDIEKKEKPFDASSFKKIEATKKTPEIYGYSQPTNGLVYLKFEYEILNLPEFGPEILPSLGLLLSNAGTKKHSYDELALLLNSHIGGISFSPQVTNLLNNKKKFSFDFNINLRCLEENLPKSLSLLEEMIFELSFKDKSHIENLIQRRANGLKNSVLQRGHAFAGSIAKKNIDSISALEDSLYGLGQVKTAVDLAKNKKLLKLLPDLEGLAKNLLATKPKIVLIARDSFLAEANNALEKYNKKFDYQAEAKNSFKLSNLKPENEIWQLATPVSYMAKAYIVKDITEPNASSYTVLANLIRSEYLHRAIREQGGAYGSMASYDSDNGLFVMLSYRDPNFLKTWATFDEALDWANKGKFNDEQLESAIIQTFGQQDSPLSPVQKAYKHYYMLKKGITLDFKNKLRAEMLGIDKKAIQSAAKNWQKFTSSLASVTASEIWAKNKSNISDKKFTEVKL